MNRYLIDTHIAIWALENNERISQKVKRILEDKNIEILLSQVSLYEIAIKQKLGKLPEVTHSIQDLVIELEAIDFQIIPVKNEHINAYNSIELQENHRDPFDRLIIATAFEENIPLISADEKFKSYRSQIQLIDNQ
jgi:PIN domain nuclease of toxin-antitoxin system